MILLISSSKKRFLLFKNHKRGKLAAHFSVKRKNKIWGGNKSRNGDNFCEHLKCTEANKIRPLDHIRKTCSQNVQGEKLKNLSAVFEKKAQN